MATANNSFNSAIETSLQAVYTTLNNFAKGDDFVAKVQSIFGTNFDAGKLEEIRQQWINSDFTSLPAIEIRTGSELKGANAAYAGSNNTIYVSEEFLTQNNNNLQGITSVLLEEIGHSVDWKINTSDTPGDEGALFSATVLGQHLDASTLDLVKQEDDSNVLTVDKSNLQVEQSIGTKVYSDNLSFGAFVYNANTSEYLNNFFGLNVDNSWEYNSGDAFKYKYTYGGKTDSYNVNASIGQASAGLTLGGGSVESGIEFKTGYNLGELNLDLPFSSSLDASANNNQLSFDFTNIYNGQFEYIAPSIYASLDAVLNYDIGGLDAFFGISGFGASYTKTIPLFSGQSNQLSHTLLEFDSNNLEDGISKTFNILDVASVEVTIPQFDPTTLEAEVNGEYSLEIGDETEVISASLGLDQIVAEAAKIFGGPGAAAAGTVLAGSVSAPVGFGGVTLGADWRLFPIDLGYTMDLNYSYKAGIRNGSTEIVGGEFQGFNNPFNMIDELLEKDQDNDSKIGVAELEYE
ncbi:hypothetical protein [Microcoleus sp. herbarium5]|uniref:hypothetical protein n=1 Tax=Microcoleus sp. herbarium5 TaxID=3055434 RepID=UPI002FD69668